MRSSYQGITLLELVMVILILSIIVGMSSALLTQGLNTYSEGENIINANWQAQIALERMTRDIMLIRSPSDVTTIGASNFAFTDIDGNTISYALSSGSLTLTQNGTASVLADGIQSLTFTYFSDVGTTTATASLVRYVEVAINVTQNNVNYTLTTMIFPRNLP